MLKQSLFIFAIITFLIFGGIFTYLQMKSGEQQFLHTSVVATDATSTKSTQTQTDVVMNWQTYRNENYRFSFEYPLNIAVNVEKIPSPVDFLPTPLFAISFPFAVQTGIEYSSSVSIYEKEEFLSKDYDENRKEAYSRLIQDPDGFLTENINLSSEIGGPHHLSLSKMQISGIPALSYCVASTGGFGRSVIFEKNGLMFVIQHYLPCHVMQELKDNGNVNFEHLLSSFKFE